MRFIGLVGFQVDEEEKEVGVWKPVFLERKYVGDILRNHRSYQITDKQNADLEINNQISILSDLYAHQNWNSIRYVIWNNVKWTVSSVELSYPRLILELGGVYNDVTEDSDKTDQVDPKRNELHKILCEDLGSNYCYFSPPSNVKMHYPCIIYNYEETATIHADNKRYFNKKCYSLMLIDENPDSVIRERLSSDCRLTYLNEDVTFVSDGLYHYPYTLYF